MVHFRLHPGSTHPDLGTSRSLAAPSLTLQHRHAQLRVLPQSLVRFLHLTTGHWLFDTFKKLILQTVTVYSSLTFLVITNHDNEPSSIYIFLWENPRPGTAFYICVDIAKFVSTEVVLISISTVRLPVDPLPNLCLQVPDHKEKWLNDLSYLILRSIPWDLLCKCPTGYLLHPLSGIFEMKRIPCSIPSMPTMEISRRATYLSWFV